MAWQTGLIDITAPEEAQILYVKQLMDFMSSSHISAVAVNAGGTGYTVGDILTISGGTILNGMNAEAEVTAVSSGVVTGIRLTNTGAFSVAPTTITGASTTGGTGTGCTLDLTMDDWMTAAIQAGGTGYVVGDILTLSGGTNGGTAATFRVEAETGGVVDSVRLITVGDYSELPTDPASTTGGTGSGCTLNLTRVGWLINEDDYTDNETAFEAILTGVNSAGTDPVVGLRVNESNPRMQGFVATGYNSLNSWESQPGTSPTDTFASLTSGNDTTIPLVTTDFDFFFFVSGRRIILLMQSGNTYEMGYFGCFVPFVDSPSSLYPAPFIAAGTVSRLSEDINDVESSLHNIFIRPNGGNAAFIRKPDGVWTGLDDEFKIWPIQDSGDMVNASEAHASDLSGGTLAPSGSTAEFDDDFFNGGAGLETAYAAYGIGSRTYFCEPHTIVRDEVGAVEIIGEIEGLFAIPGRGLSVEDLVQDADGNDHQVFVNLNSNTLDDFYTVIRN